MALSWQKEGLGWGRWCCAACITSDGDSRLSWPCRPILRPVAGIQAASPGETDNPGRAQGNKVSGWDYAEQRGAPGLSRTPCPAPPHPQVVTGWALYLRKSTGEGHTQTGRDQLEAAMQGRRRGPLWEESVRQNFWSSFKKHVLIIFYLYSVLPLCYIKNTYK